MIVEAARERNYEQNKFLAALKGINLEENAAPTRVEEIKKRLAAKEAGLSEEAYELDGMFGFEAEEDEQE